MTPLKAAWMQLYTPITDHLKLDMRMNLKTKKVEIKTSAATQNGDMLQRAADFVHAFLLGFEIRDAVALLRLDDLYVECFEVKDVKTLRGEHLSRCIGRLAGKVRRGGAGMAAGRAGGRGRRCPVMLQRGHAVSRPPHLSLHHARHTPSPPSPERQDQVHDRECDAHAHRPRRHAHPHPRQLPKHPRGARRDLLADPGVAAGQGVQQAAVGVRAAERQLRADGGGSSAVRCGAVRCVLISSPVVGGPSVTSFR
jgi:hypothetical protein